MLLLWTLVLSSVGLPEKQTESLILRKAERPEYLLIVKSFPESTNSSPESSSELHILGPVGSYLSLRHYTEGRVVVGSDIGQGYI